MRLGILPEALKQRDDPMLIRQELVKLIEAWPDESGVSSDPEAYNAWMEIEKKHFGVWRGSSTVVLKENGLL